MSGSANKQSDSATPSWSASLVCAESHGRAASSESSATYHCASPTMLSASACGRYKGRRLARASAVRREFDVRSFTRTRCLFVIGSKYWKPPRRALSIGSGNRGASEAPLLSRGGVAATLKKAAKPPYWSGRGGTGQELLANTTPSARFGGFATSS